MSQFRFSALAALTATLLFAVTTIRAEDQPKPDQPKPDQPKLDRGNRGGGGGPGGGRGNWGGGQPGGFDPRAAFGGMTGGLGNILGTRGTGGTSSVYSIAARAMGVDIQDPKAIGKVEDLPLGASKPFMTEVPVGGVDNLKNNSKGWNMENVFTMTPEQTKSVEALREEFATEEKKLQQENAELTKKMAEKAIALRTQFEKRANELLTGADKESKEKLDALAADVRKKQADVVAETLPLVDMKDMAAGFTMIRALSEKTNKIAKDGEMKLLDLIPEASKDKIQTLIKAQEDAQNRANRIMGGRGMGGPGGNDAVKPPKPPDTTEKQF